MQQLASITKAENRPRSRRRLGGNNRGSGIIEKSLKDGPVRQFRATPLSAGQVMKVFSHASAVELCAVEHPFDAAGQEIGYRIELMGHPWPSSSTQPDRPFLEATIQG